MRTKTSLLFAIALIGLTATGLHAQVAINNTAATPDASAILDLKTGNGGVNKGFLPQAVALTNVTLAAPVTSPATGLIVYSSTAPTGGTGAGYYYWTGSAWANMNFNGSGAKGQVTYWGGSNSIVGDTSLYWNSANVKLGIGTSHPFESLDINQTNTPNTAKFGNVLPVCFIANSPMVGFNAYWNSGTSYYSTGYAGMIQFDQVIPGAFQFLTAPSGTALTPATMTLAMVILNNGYVGIGTNAPIFPLYVVSSSISTSGEFDNSVSSGTSLIGSATGTGNSWGVDGATTSASGVGTVGVDNAVSGIGTGTGVYGSTSQSKGYGVEGINYYATKGNGIGILGEGSGALNYIPTFSPGYSPGIYGEGNYIGVCGYADNAGIDNPVEGINDNGIRYSILAYWNGATDYKVLGTGVASTIIKDNSSVLHILNCPEAPEVLFEDYGSATLSNGKVHVDLDQLYAQNVTINQKHPLRVLITLNDQCNGVYVTNRTTTGFDVVELNNGTSNAAFTYEVIANRADEYDANGNLVSKFEDNRYQVYTKSTSETTNTASSVSNRAIGKPAAPAPAAPTPAVVNHSNASTK